MAEIIAERSRERQRLLALAAGYVERLSCRIPVEAAAVAGSVARGDFNVWSDVDVVVVAEGLPARQLERSALLLLDAPPRIQPVGYSRAELEQEWRKGNRLVREAVTSGVTILGELASVRRG